MSILGYAFAMTRTKLVCSFMCLLIAIYVAPVSAQADQVETIVIFRHGEKPTTGLGQLVCKGLNRSLALPNVLFTKFGRPAALFAPNPAIQIPDAGCGAFSYVRPLATIEPTAIALYMPVNTQYGYTSLGDLQTAVLQTKFATSTVFIAWEHGQIGSLAASLLRQFGRDASQVPPWSDCNYDMIFVIKVTRKPGHPSTAQFSTQCEGLDLSQACLDGMSAKEKVCPKAGPLLSSCPFAFSGGDRPPSTCPAGGAP